MKSNIENSIKESLEKFELPYDASAWDAMSKKLDAAKPGASNGGGSSIGKWVAAAGIATISTIGILYLFNSDDSSSTSAQSATNKNITSEVSNSSNDNKNVIEGTSSNSNVINDNEGIENSSINNINQTSTSTSHSTSNNELIETQSTNTFQNPVDNQNTTSNNTLDSNNPNSPSNTIEKVLIPNIKDGCQGDFKTIVNDNNRRIRIISPSNDIYEVQPNSTLTIEATVSGEYKVEIQKSAWKEISSFTIGKKPQLDFTANESTQYENGIPSIPLVTYSEGSNLTWSFEGIKQNQKGNEAFAHFYSKGKYNVTLTGEGTLGCISSTSKTIEVYEDYNLFAPTAFIPGDANPKNAFFMPMALTVRDVQFNMIIIDPKSGNVVFETNNASNGWDGIDKNTGQMTRPNTAYIWKVVLQNPEPGERSEYSGTITRL